MAFKQSFEEARRAILPSTSPENGNGCFECNICLDSARDPIVTLCGHLYCWPCIYKWLQVQSSTPHPEPDSQPNCPVCKAHISTSSLVPLYGRANSASESEDKKSQQLDLSVPSRPLPPGSTNQNPQPQPLPPSFTSPPPPHRTGSVVAQHNFGEMVFARIFGGTDADLLTYPFPSTYMLLNGSSNPRVRRQEMKDDKFLSRLSLFLLCCFVLCLILF